MSTLINYKITASYNFISIFQNLEQKKPPAKYPDESPDAVKITHFMSEYLSNGWEGNLKGKNTPTDNVPTDDPQWRTKVKYAQDNNLYHYHIGIPYYSKSEYGYDTSNYVLHYQQLTEHHIKLVDLDQHSPMKQPQPRELEGDFDLST